MLLICYDIIAVSLSYFLALWLRFDCKFSQIGTVYLSAWKKFTPIYIVFCLIIFWRAKLYKSIWKYASYSELIHLIEANAITWLFHTVFITILFRRMPIFNKFGAILQFVLMWSLCIDGGSISYRFIILLRRPNSGYARDKNHVMIIGAGNAGQQIIRDIMRSRELDDKVCCVIDDDPINGDAILKACKSSAEETHSGECRKVQHR